MDGRLRWIGLLPLAGILATALPVGGQDLDEGQTLRDFRIPEYDESMQLKSQLFGELARIMEDGTVRITNLKIEFYKEGKIEMTVTAPQCTYDRGKKAASSESTVRIARENMVVTGKGFSWSVDDEAFRIDSKVKVVLKDIKKGMETSEGEEQ
jgi:hypothetical protein